jgi:hypothetical protein
MKNAWDHLNGIHETLDQGANPKSGLVEDEASQARKPAQHVQLTLAAQNPLAAFAQ